MLQTSTTVIDPPPRDMKTLSPEEKKVFHEESEYVYRQPLIRYLMRRIHQCVGDGCRPRDIILNLGCGTGFQNTFLPHRSLIGIDNNIWRLRVARTRFPLQSFICCDALNLPIRDGSVDRLISCDFIEHIGELSRLYSEMYRVLKPTGTCVISFPAEGGFAHSLGRRLTTRKYYEGVLNIDYMKLVKQEHRHNARQILSSLKQNFELVSLKYIPFLIPSIDLNACLIATCKLKPC
jgi:ubiquinone/menaquinone biosynthesis C-methylase UbiE